MKRVARGFRWAVFLLAAGIAATAAVADDAQARPEELVRYVRQARQSGMKDAGIRENAIAAGWPPSTVDRAIAYVNEGQAPKEIARAAGAPSPASGTTPLSAAGVPRIDRSVPPGISDSAKGHASLDDYRIGAGDVLQISVWKEPDVSIPRAVVRPDGRITLPLLKEVAVAGLTTTDAEKTIASGLSKFIADADVTVVVTAINSKRVFVIGAVRKEGPIPYSGRMTAIQAISEAGGLNDYAKRKRIYILRTENGKSYRLPFNFDEVIKGRNMAQNVELLPGDTLYVPH